MDIRPTSLSDKTTLGALTPARLEPVAREYARHRYAANTARAYASDMRIWRAWCSRNGQPALPASPAAVAAFLLDLSAGISTGAPRKRKTIERYLSSISTAHVRAGHESPWSNSVVKDTLVSIRNKKAAQGEVIEKKEGLLVEELREVLAAIPRGGASELRGLRDRALLLLGFAGAFRRSELVGMDVENFKAVPGQGVLGRIRRSKTDQAGAGRDVAIQFAKRHEDCPVRSVQAWLNAAGITTGPVFRPVWGHTVGKRRLSDDAYVQAIKKAVARVGLDPGGFAGHSLRSGWITTADRAGKSVGQISQQTGHKSAQQVLEYMRSKAFGPGSAGFGLMDRKP